MEAESKESKVIDLRSIIGFYPICNTGAVLIHQIDYGEDKVLASINGTGPEWCQMVEESVDGELELGFRLGSFFVPLADVMRF